MRWLDVNTKVTPSESEYYQYALMELGGDTPSWYGVIDVSQGYVYSNIKVIIDGFTKPSEEDVNAKITELKTAYNNAQYVRNRKPEYPDIGDQLDDLFKAGAFSTEMAAKIQAVKDKYPKDNT
jgi:hypothetical protein